MKRIAFVIALLCAAGVGAESLQEWRTPDGKIFFGDRPPQGSTAVKKVEKQISTVSVRGVPARALPEPEHFVWRDDSSCMDMKFAELKEEPFDGIARRTVHGVVTHDGKHLVKDVRVCGAGQCGEELRAGDGMVNGDREDFRMDVFDVPSSQRVAMRIECSVREPG